MNEGIFEEAKKLTYDNFVQMVRDDMMAGSAPDEYPSDEQVRKDAKYLYNQYLQGASVEDLFEVEEGIFDRFKKKSSSEERPMGTGTTMDGGFGFASDESYELLKKIAKEKGAELTGMGENERYISFGLATTENDTYTERDYYYDKETGKIIEKGIPKQLPENVNEGDLDLGHQDNEPHMLKANL